VSYSFGVKFQNALGLHDFLLFFIIFSELFLPGASLTQLVFVVVIKPGVQKLWIKTQDDNRYFVEYRGKKRRATVRHSSRFNYSLIGGSPLLPPFSIL